jgi:hypothetical protein
VSYVPMTRARRGQTGPSTAEVLVRLDHKGLDPVCDGLRAPESLPELTRPSDVLEILQEQD